MVKERPFPQKLRLYYSYYRLFPPAKQGKTLHFEVKIRRITSMERGQIRQIVNYVKELEKGLVEWDYDHIAMQAELPYLYQVIKQLMDATYKAEDQRLKPLLATLEYKARKCKQCIEDRLTVRN